jgi:hypothetical protein
MALSNDTLIKTIFSLIKIDRRYQLSLYDEFKSSNEAAHLLENIRKDLKMTQPFTELGDLLTTDATSRGEWTLAKMDKNLERTLQVLKSMMNPAKIECLKEFVNSFGLVNWLRSTVNNLKEFSFLIDLASLTPTGEYAQNSAVFAKALKEAGVAYAPLIFDLKLDDTFTQFIKHCDTIWKNLKDDKDIAQKLRAVKDSVEMLEQIKNKKGIDRVFSKLQWWKFNGFLTI